VLALRAVFGSEGLNMSASFLKGNIFDLQPLEIRRLLTTATLDAAGILQVLGTGSAEAPAQPRPSPSIRTPAGRSP
jgi:hypothetical protein